MSNKWTWSENQKAPPAKPGVMSGMDALASAAPILQVLGSIQSGFGTYFAAEGQKTQLQFQSDMSAINARMAERTAQSILQAGQVQIGHLGMRAGQVKGAQRASQAARGIVAGVGNAAEEIATTDLMKETDTLTIDANAVRQASAARTQAVNMANDSLMKGTTADSISSASAMSTSMVNSATAVASSWYSRRRMGVD